jgi:ketosteroid isomerase-like protein
MRVAVWRFIAFTILALVANAVRPASAQSKPVVALLAADGALERAYAAKNVSTALSFFAPNASVLGAGVPTLSGRAAIRKSLADAFERSDLSISWHADKADVATSGDFGYTSGKNRVSFGSKSKTLPIIGKYVTVWKRQPDRTWKVILDIYNGDAPG